MRSKKASQQNVLDQVEECKRKLQLLEGDRKAYYESSQWTIKQNKEHILKLRKEVKELQKLKADRLAADEHVVNEGLAEHPVERNALRDKPGNVAVVKMDEKVRDSTNRLNLQVYRTSQKQKRVEELRTQYDQMLKDASDAVATDSGDSPEAQELRSLENRLDKARLKCKEAEHIHKTYEQIKGQLEDEHKTFEQTLDEMEQEIMRCRSELKELKAMNNDAQIARDTAKADLERQERQVYQERKERELELAQVKKEADEKRIQHERIERRIHARGSITQDELSPAEKQILTGEEEQQKITEYEMAFKRIKEATGVSDTQEVVTRFENQGDTTTHLEELKRENEKQISRLNEEKEKLQVEFEEMKYSGEAKLSSGQRLLEEFETHLAEEEGRREAAQDRLDKSSRILTSAKSGVEHLAEKLKHLKAPSSQVQKAKISPSSDEYVLDQLSQCEEKLLKLLEELDGKELEEVSKQMEEEEFQANAELKVPQNNTRVKLPTMQKDNMYDDDEDSGEDEDILTRANLKRQAQQLVDAKNRRKVTRKKKTKK